MLQTATMVLAARGEIDGENPASPGNLKDYDFITQLVESKSDIQPQTSSFRFNWLSRLRYRQNLRSSPQHNIPTTEYGAI
eukprot:4671329-Heterocapsa_arctica.AAC.1